MVRTTERSDKLGHDVLEQPELLSYDVVIIGSGPAGVAVAERLCERHPSATVALIERGPLLLRRHFYDDGGSIGDRDRFFALHRECPWDGDLSEGGALLPCVGGRGVVGGSQLHRFYRDDYSIWLDGQWSVDGSELDGYFAAAEDRLFGRTRSTGASQDYACSALAGFAARHPPCAPSAEGVSGRDSGLPHRSSVERLLSVLGKEAASGTDRVAVFAERVAVELVTSSRRPDEVSHVRCLPAARSGGSSSNVHGRLFVLAASPVESARLVLASKLESVQADNSAVGQYLSEHIYCRGYLDVSSIGDLSAGPINVYIPPPGTGLAERFQIEVKSFIDPSRSSRCLRLTGSAAMDPRRNNCVQISSDRIDRYGVPRAHTSLTYSRDDRLRTRLMLDTLNSVASCLHGRWLTPPVRLPQGASYHEAGTLRMSNRNNATSSDGLLRGTSNVYPGDGSVFACVGVANPILTLTALGYRLGDRLALRLDSR